MTMSPARLLLIVLLPLICANVILWALYAESVIAAAAWAIAGIGSIKLVNWSQT